MSSGDGSDEVRHIPTSIPVTWESGATGHTEVGKPASIITPSGKDISQYACEPYNVCGTCKYFDHANGQKQIIQERFAERLVREEKWKVEHLGAPITSIGLCGRTNGETATTPISKACDQYVQLGRRR